MLLLEQRGYWWIKVVAGSVVCGVSIGKNGKHLEIYVEKV